MSLVLFRFTLPVDVWSMKNVETREIFLKESTVLFSVCAYITIIPVEVVPMAQCMYHYRPFLMQGTTFGTHIHTSTAAY